VEVFLESHSERKAAEAFGIAKNRVTNITKRNVEHLQRIEHANDKLHRKIRKTSNDDINKATRNWFHKMGPLSSRI
jgi:hypothetical protein